MSLTLSDDDLGDAQSGAVGRAQRGPVLRTRRRFEQPRYLLDAQHQRQLARLADERETAGEIGPVQRHGEEEAQRRDRAVDARRLEARLGLVHLEPAQVLGCGLVGGAAEEGGEGLHTADVVVLRLLGEAAHGHVLDHALAQARCRTEATGGRSWGAPLKLKVDPSCSEAEHRPSPLIDHSLTDARGSASAFKRAPSRASGFVPWHFRKYAFGSLRRS